MDSDVGGSPPGPQQYSGYLHLLARQQLSPALQAKADLSDVVNRTVQEALAEQDKLRGWSEEARLRRLRVMLANNLKDEIRRPGVGRRAAHENVSIEQGVEESSIRLVNVLVSEQTSPSQKVSRKEELAKRATILNDALLKLPDRERTAVELYYLKELTQAEVADEMETTRPAVAGLLRRGLDRLRHLLGDQAEILL